MSRSLRDMLIGALAATAIAALWPRAEPVAALEGAAGNSDYLIATGTSKYSGALLFLFDTRSKVLAVYEAEGGTAATRGVTWVGARKLEWDTHTTELNDKSEHSFNEMKQLFLDRQAALGTGDAADGTQK
jgi:hypothetical protein